MKFKLFFLSLCLLFVGGAQAQTAEPNFIGEVFHVDAAGQTSLLEKQQIVLKTKAGASMYIFGVGKVKTKINIQGNASTSRFPQTDTLKLIVKAVDNATDPMSVVQVFSFEITKKARKAELSSTGTFGGITKNKLNYLPFTATKYGESSYLLSLPNVKPGEYGIIVLNPNSESEKSTVVSCFGID